MVEIARTPEEFEALVAPIVAEAAEKGRKRFVSSEWALMFETLEESTLVTAQGSGCTYVIVQLREEVMIAWRGDGPYPFASLWWIEDTVENYPDALRVLAGLIENGG